MSTIIAKHFWPVRAAATIFDWFGPTLHGAETDAKATVNQAWIVLLALNAPIALLLVAIGQGAGRRGDEDISIIWFWAGVVLLLLPMISRIAYPVVARNERLILIALLGLFLFLFKMLYSPSSFEDFDEMIHWMSAHGILYHHKLFLGNDLLPASAFYPGIEILTTALCNITGLPIFAAATLILGVLRITFLVTLFLFFEKLSDSARLAALACLIYMSCSTFIAFDVAFSYESLGIVLCIIVMLAEASMMRRASETRSLALPAILLACLTVTHHMTAFWCAAYMIGLVVVETVHRDDKSYRTRIGITGAIAFLALAFPLLWMTVRGNPLIPYMEPVLGRAADSMYERLTKGTTTGAAPRVFFVGADGTPQPIGNRIIGIGSTILLAIGLSTGYFRSMALAGSPGLSGWYRLWQVIGRRWRDSRLVLLTIGSWGFPLSIFFRLTPENWEVGDRMNTSVFFSVGLVIAASIIHFWQSPQRINRGTLMLMNVTIVTILMGGIIVGEGVRLIRTPYKVVADAASVEPMGIDAARWTKEWLGTKNGFVADRDGRTLLGTYGEQRVRTTLDGGIAAAGIFFPPTITEDSLDQIKRGHIDYIWADLRLTTDLSVLGEYYEANEKPYSHGRPPSPKSMLKFDNEKNISRIFDDGWIIIYDVKALKHAQQ
jgi:hypothetical protein